MSYKMNRRMSSFAALTQCGLFFALMSVLFPANSAQANEGMKATQTLTSLSLDAAQLAANTALKHCQKKGALVAVAMVDRSGIPLVMVRDALAGMHTPETATRKAWTAVSFKTSSAEMAKATTYNQPSSGIRGVSNVAMIAGGLVIQASGSIIGGIGVSGAPNGEMDDECAKAGIASIQDAIDLN
ncbi:MAG: heme-binding protein [Undibacterium sp.]|uniref:GlcG/HbpS family heme-binding protein n=1 Tax=Undibacterium sp. TaxID=1914977 RepID=UPI0027199419|nr:heme-binding protein [Undibacterium sp.]MDO8650626.1 heme-binding protein [Undibacterium sp.]